MNDSKLIYINDCYKDGDSFVVRYEDVTKEVVDKILDIQNIEELEARIPSDRMNTSPNVYLDRFMLFEEEFDISQNGFQNAEKGGNDPRARSLRGSLQHLNQKNRRNLLELSEENNVNTYSGHDWYVCIFNVGNGESNLLVAPDGKLYLFDGGCLNQGICSKINKVICHFKQNKINISKEISGFFISHCDGDHFKGVIEAISHFNTSPDCFLYYNYVSSFSKPSWVNGLARIDKLACDGKISKYVLIPEKNKLGEMSSLIPSLHITWMWPYNENRTQCVTNDISSNDSSHCLYISDKFGKFSINFFGDAETVAGSNIDFDTAKLDDNFVFKPSHHGRNSGNIKIKSYASISMHDHFSQCPKVKFFVSSTNKNNNLSPIASTKSLTESAQTAIIFKFSSSGVLKCVI
jgi:beta-lactamase superfamily II metal-dependent hydrolase